MNPVSQLESTPDGRIFFLTRWVLFCVSLSSHRGSPSTVDNPRVLKGDGETELTGPIASLSGTRVAGWLRPHLRAFAQLPLGLAHPAPTCSLNSKFK